MKDRSLFCLGRQRYPKDKQKQSSSNRFQPSWTPGTAMKESILTEKKDMVDLNQKKRVVSFKRKKSSSKYRGVLFVKSQNKWRAQICLDGKKKYLGSYDTEIEAAIARDNGFRTYIDNNRPEMLNFPERPNPADRPITTIPHFTRTPCARCNLQIAEIYNRCMLEHVQESKKKRRKSTWKPCGSSSFTSTAEPSKYSNSGLEIALPELPGDVFEYPQSHIPAPYFYLQPPLLSQKERGQGYLSDLKSPMNYEYFTRNSQLDFAVDPTQEFIHDYAEHEECFNGDH